MVRISLPAIPEVGTTLLGAMELFGAAGVAWRKIVERRDSEPLFDVQIVSESGAALSHSAQWTVQPHAKLAEVDRTDVVFVPSLWIAPGDTFAGRHAALKEWIVRQYRGGAMVCAACTGVLLVADAGLLDGEAATTHWAYEDAMRTCYPRIDVQSDRILVESGDAGRLVTSGSHAAWHDLVLSLIARTAGQEAAMQTAKFFLLQWHTGSQAPYRAFQERDGHGDAVIRGCQEWLRKNFSHPVPVETVERESGLAARSFKRRFKSATGMTVIAYVQQLRVERAKALLERGDLPIDEISWRIGYEDVAFFRRLFRRLTSLSPREYRRRFRMPHPGSLRG